MLDQRKGAIMSKTLCYRQWLVNYGFDPRSEGPAGERIVFRAGSLADELADHELPETDDATASVDTVMVRRAIRRLGDDEREIIERFYYMGQSYGVIANALHREAAWVERRHRLALRRLRRMLEPWVRTGDPASLEESCRICQSAHRDAIDDVIRTKTVEESYRRVLKILRGQFGIRLNHPHLVIRHQNFHMIRREA
jgi:RNA polymerase sigma factor (sigma-70 family)